MPRYTNSFIEVSALGNLESEIQKLYRQIRNGTAKDDPSIETSTAATDPSTSKTYANIVIDDGNARIKSGLKSLELLSILRSGTSPQNLFLFDNVIYVGSPVDFETSNEERLVSIVVQNLGMALVVDTLAEETTERFRGVCLKIAMLVKTGKYNSSMYSEYIIKESRRLVKLFVKVAK